MKVAIVGCGNISRLHFSAVDSCPLTELVAAVDTKPERAEKFAEKYGGRVYTSFDEMLEKEKPDAVHICTPHCFHTPYAVKALERGIHVFSEKPCSVSDAEVEALRAAQKASGAKYAVCFQNRYNDCARYIIDTVKNGDLGKLLSLRAFVTWNRGERYYSDDWHGKLAQEGGCLLINQAIHTLDLLIQLGGKLKAVTGHVSNDHLQGVIEGEDTASALIEFENGVKAVFYGTTAHGSDAPVLIEAAFENGVLRSEGEKLFKVSADGSHEEVPLEAKKAEGKGCWGSGHSVIINDFYYSIEEKRDFAVDSFSGGEAARLVFGIYRSSADGSKVYF